MKAVRGMFMAALSLGAAVSGLYAAAAGAFQTSAPHNGPVSGQACELGSQSAAKSNPNKLQFVSCGGFLD